MFTGLTAFFAGLFSSTKAQDLAVDVVRKMGGLNQMSDQEKSEFLLQYMAATKHQSPVRRLIALMLSVMFMVLAALWALMAGIGYLATYTPALEFAGALKMFLELTLMQPFNLILSFYFVIGAAQKLK